MNRRVAIVTGASSGIGRALTERAVRAGWNVVGVGRRSERLDELARMLEGATGTLATLALDLRTTDAARRIVRETLERFGRIDVLVNAAGGVAVGAIAEQSDDALYEQMQTHVIVPLALTREALPALRTSRGGIIYFGSGVARIPVGTLGAYPPAKAAVRSLARIARNELRGAGVAVTYVDPGAVATEFMTRAGFAGPPPALAASPHAVARRVFAAFTSRRPVVNAVPWQTFFVALAEMVPALTDYILTRAPQIIGGAPQARAVASDVLAHDASPDVALATPLPTAQAFSESETALEETAPQSYLDRALEMHERRMNKLHLSAAFLRGVLVPGKEIELSDVAMQWAGMPNKNERALTSDVFAALAEAGYVERLGDERYRVMRPADD